MAKQTWTAWRVFEKFAIVLGVALSLEQLLSLIGWLPGYKIERIPLSTVSPAIWQVPGQKIRFSPQFPDGIMQDDVESVTWTLSSGGGRADYFSADGYEPTVILPPTRGGLLVLSVQAQVRGERKPRVGSRSIYVVQDDGQQVKYSKPKPVSLGVPTKTNASNETLQLFTADNTWIDSGSLGFPVQADLKLVIPRGVALKVIDGKLIYRRKGMPNDLKAYGTIKAP